MVRIVPIISSGASSLVLSDSFICDDREEARIDLPTSSGRFQTLVFSFEPGEPVTPSYTFAGTHNLLRINVVLGSRPGNFLATKHRIDLEVEGKQYFYLFALTRLTGNAVRLEISIFETAGR